VVLLVAGKLADFGVGAGCDGPFVKIARDLVVRRHGRPMLLLVDLKAGIEDTSRGVVTGMDQLIVICDPSTAGLGMAVAMRQIIDDLSQGAEPATVHIESKEMAELARRLFRESRLRDVHVVLNKVPNLETGNYMTQVLDSAGIKPLAILRHSQTLENAWLMGDVLPTTEQSDALNAAIDELEQETVIRRASGTARVEAGLADE
jgi:CO dehydrogenase nickel-insertion accessory protein CooC1